MIPIAKPFLGKEEVAAAREVILSGWVSQGPKVAEFERNFASYVSSKYACAVSSCTTALHVALMATGVKKNDTVITVSHSFIATANSVRYSGANPVFVDIDLDTFNMSPAALQKCLSEDCRVREGKLFHKSGRVGALLVVHQMGMPADLNAILPIARKFKIPVIEDAACAAGSEISINGGKAWDKIGKPHGDIACFSFHPRKLMTTGEGGMLTTNNTGYDKYFRLLRHQGMSISDRARHESKKVIFEEYPIVGYNYRMTDIQAAIGIAQLAKIKKKKIIERRREIAGIYRQKLKDTSWLKLPAEPEYCRANRQSYPVRILEDAPKKQAELMQYLLARDVSTRRGIMNAHQEPAYKSDMHLKNSEQARDTVILLPIFHEMTGIQIEEIARSIKRADSV